MTQRKEPRASSPTGAASRGKKRMRSLEAHARQPVVLPWEGPGVTGKILKSLSTHDSNRTSRTVRTTHQEKTCEMFMKYEKEIDRKSSLLSTIHTGFFICLITLAVAFCHVHLTLLTWKTRVVVSEEDVYTEIIGMRNVSTTLQRVRALATVFGTTMQRVAVEGVPLRPVYVEGHVYMQLYHISLHIITGLEHIRGYDVSIRSATQCLGQSAPARARATTVSTCPLKVAISRLSLISPHLENELRSAVLNIKLPLSTALEEKILDAYPTSWRDVHEPYGFVRELLDYGGIQFVYDAATNYNDALYQIIHKLRMQRIWPRLLQEPLLGIFLQMVIILCFVAAVKFCSSRTQRAFSICQEAVAMSDIDVQSKVSDLSNVLLATFEHQVLPRLHPLSGLASLLISTTQLTEYHHKLLKVMEKCVADLIDSSVNSLEFIVAEAEIVQPSADLADLRLIVEDCLELFRPKATAKKLPLTCTFGTGCPSVAILDVPRVKRVISRMRLCKTIVLQTLSYVLDHTYEKGLGIHVYINANASHTSFGQEDSTMLRAYDIHIEVKGLGVCMENYTAQRLVLVGGVYDRYFLASLLDCTRRGQGLRLLTASRTLQSMGGSMQIQSSPSRGTFFSLALRAKARFYLLDLHEDFDVITGKEARILTIGLTPETRRFMSFLCKDIGIRCIHCFCFRKLLDSVSEISEEETLAIFVGDYIQISADPADKHTRILQPQEIFEKVREAATEELRNATTVFVASMEADSLTGASRTSPVKLPSHERFIR